MCNIILNLYNFFSFDKSSWHTHYCFLGYSLMLMGYHYSFHIHDLFVCCFGIFKFSGTFSLNWGDDLTLRNLHRKSDCVQICYSSESSSISIQETGRYFHSCSIHSVVIIITLIGCVFPPVQWNVLYMRIIINVSCIIQYSPDVREAEPSKLSSMSPHCITSVCASFSLVPLWY